MKRSNSQEPLKSSSYTPRSSQSTTIENGKRSSISRGFRKLFRNRSVSITRDSFSSASHNFTPGDMDDHSHPRLCTSLSTFFNKYCNCCCCCWNGCCTTKDSPPFKNKIHKRGPSRRCLCCFPGSRRKEERISMSEPRQLSPPPTALPALRVRFEDPSSSLDRVDLVPRWKERVAGHRDKSEPELLKSIRDTVTLREQRQKEGNVKQESLDESVSSDSSTTITTEPTPTSVSMQPRFPEYQQDLMEDTTLHPFDLPRQLESLPLVETAIGWHLSVIPEFPPLMTFIPTNALSAPTTSDVMELYHSNLVTQDDLLSFHQQPLPNNGVEEEIHPSHLANSNPPVVHTEDQKVVDKNRHFSSSDSSRTSDVLFMSADEGESSAEEIFYDPMRIEPAMLYDQPMDSIVELGNYMKPSAERRYWTEEVSNEREATIKDVEMIFNDPMQCQTLLLGSEESRAGVSKISIGFEQSPENVFPTKTSNLGEPKNDSFVRFNASREVANVRECEEGDMRTADYLDRGKDLTEESARQVDGQRLRVGRLDVSHVEKEDNMIESEERFAQGHETSMELCCSDESNVKLSDFRVAEMDATNFDKTESIPELPALPTEDEVNATTASWDKEYFKGSMGETSQTDEEVEPRWSKAKSVILSLTREKTADKCEIGASEINANFDILLCSEGTQHKIKVEERKQSEMFTEFGGSGEYGRSSDYLRDSVVELNTLSVEVGSGPTQVIPIASPEVVESVSSLPDREVREKQRESPISPESSEMSSLSVTSGDFFQTSEGNKERFNFGQEGGEKRELETAEDLGLTDEVGDSTTPQLEPMSSMHVVEASISLPHFTGAQLAKNPHLNDERQQAGSSEMFTEFGGSGEYGRSSDYLRDSVVELNTLSVEVGSGPTQVIPIASPEVAESVSSLPDREVREKQRESPISPESSEMSSLSVTSGDFFQTSEGNKERFNFGQEGGEKRELETAEDLGLTDEVGDSTTPQLEPMSSMHVVKASISLPHFTGAQLAKNPHLNDERQQAGSSELCVAFNENSKYASRGGLFNNPIQKAEIPYVNVICSPTESDYGTICEFHTMGDNGDSGPAKVRKASGDYKIWLNERISLEPSLLSLHRDNVTKACERLRTVFDFGMEVVEERELDVSEDLCLSEDFHASTNWHLEPLMTVNLAECSTLLHFEGIPPKMQASLLDGWIPDGCCAISRAPDLKFEFSSSYATEATTADLISTEKSDYEGVTLNSDNPGTTEVPPAYEQSGARVEELSFGTTQGKVSTVQQPPVILQDFHEEVIGNLGVCEIASITLQPETKSPDSCLPQNLELWVLAQPFKMLEKYTDFSKFVVRERQMNVDDWTLVIPAEVVAYDDHWEVEQCKLQEIFDKASSEDMSGVRRHSIQLRKHSSHFSLDIEAFDTSKSLFESWSQGEKAERGRYYASFTVEAFRRRESSPDLVSVEEDETVERLDADNPDRWVIEAAAPDRCGRLASVCLLERPVTSHYRLATGKNPREQFREEVLTISNKQQECFMKRRHALTDLSEEEEGYQMRIKMLRNILERLDGTQFKDDKKVPVPKEMVEATAGMLSHIDRIVQLSESTRRKIQASIMDPPNAAICFIQNEPEWAQYSGYLYHLNRWMQSFKTLLTDAKLNNLFCLTPESGEEECRIDAQHLLEYLFAPRTHLSAYEHLLNSLARYTSRAEQDTRELEAAITALRRLQRRTTEALRLWPFVVNMPTDGSLGILPSDGAYTDANQLPKPIHRMTLVKLSRREGGENLPANEEVGFLVMDENNLYFLKASTEDDKRYEIAWTLPLPHIRLRKEGKGFSAQSFEIWDISSAEDPLKVIFSITAPNSVSRQAWLEDLQRNLKNKDVADCLVSETILQAHETADMENSRKRVSMADDIITETTDGITDSFYDADEMLKSKSEACPSQAKVDDESSLTYYTAEGSVMQLPKQGTAKQRPDSILSYDSVNTLDGVSNPFVEQFPEQPLNVPEVSEVVVTHSLKTDKPFVHRSEIQNINSFEGGEMELNIETSTSDSDSYTVEWTFNGASIESEKLGAYSRIEGNTVYLSVPEVSKELHQGHYECILSWPSGMKAIFPFAVVVHESEADGVPTNEVSKLQLKTRKYTKLPVADEDEVDAVQFHEVDLTSPFEREMNVDATEVKENAEMSVNGGLMEKYRIGKINIIGVHHEVPLKDFVPHEGWDTDELRETIVSTMVSETMNEPPTGEQAFVQKYMAPIKVTAREGGRLTLTVPAVLTAFSRLTWTFNGRKLSDDVFTAKIKSSEMEFVRENITVSDSGEYTFWVDGEVKANFILNVEKGGEEEPGDKVDVNKIEKESFEEVEAAYRGEETKEVGGQKPKSDTEVEVGDVKETSPKVATTQDTKPSSVVQLKEGDKFQLNANIPLNARQTKSNRLWWTKNGKSFVDVDGVAPRSAKFVSKSATKTLTTTDVSLVKKEPVSVEDAAIYALVSEPRINRGFKSKETTYTTIVVSVTERPKDDLVDMKEVDDSIRTIEEESGEESVPGVVDVRKVDEETMDVSQSEVIREDMKVDNKIPETGKTGSDEKDFKKKSVGGVGEEQSKKRMESTKADIEAKSMQVPEHASFEREPSQGEKNLEALAETVADLKEKPQVEEVKSQKVREEKSKTEIYPKEGEEEVKRKKSAEVAAESTKAEEPLKVEQNQFKSAMELKKEELEATASTGETVVKVVEGDKFQLNTNVPLDARQLKSDKLWWTKDGKEFLNVDGINPRSAKFISKCSPKPPRSTNIELSKRGLASVEDAGIYRLVGEPRIKRGFKSQETTYATIIVTVVEKLQDDSTKPVHVEEENTSLEESKKPDVVALDEAPESRQQVSSIKEREKPQEDAQVHDLSQEGVKKDELSRETQNEDEKTAELIAKRTLTDEEEKSLKGLDKVATSEEKPLPEQGKEATTKSFMSGNELNLIEGDKFQLNANIPLNARQTKSNRLWWTKNGKSFVDVDGVAPRSAKFVSKSATKTLTTTDVSLVKKEPVSVEDAAIYALVGEPRINRGFKSKETTYTTIVVSVTERPKDDLVDMKEESGEESVPGVVDVRKVDEETMDVSQSEVVRDEMKMDNKSPEAMSNDEINKDETKMEIMEDDEAPSLSEMPKKDDFVIISEEEIKDLTIEEPSTSTRNLLSITAGQELKFSTAIPRDVRLSDEEKLLWTKDGEPFLKVDEITPQSDKFVSKSKFKTSKLTEIEVTKKEPASVEDSATYVLKGESRTKPGFETQETTYATIVIKVSDKPPDLPESVTEVSPKSQSVVCLQAAEQTEPELPRLADEQFKVEDEMKPEEKECQSALSKASKAISGVKKKKVKKSHHDGEGEEGRKKSKKKKKTSTEEVEREEVRMRKEEIEESKPFETVELRCIEANANRRLGHEKIPIPAGEPLCLTVTGIPPAVTSVEWTLNGQPVRSGKRIQRLLEPNPLGKRYEGELMAQLYLDSTVLLDSGDYELTIKPTDSCPIAAHLSIPVEVLSAKKELAKRRRRAESQEGGDVKEEDDNVLQVRPSLCQPLGLAACEGQAISLIADLNVPVDKVPPESVSWRRNGVALSSDDPATDISIKRSEKNQEHTSVILHKPAVTLDDVGFYSVAYNPLPTIKEEPFAEEEDEEGYGVGWEVDFPELLVFPAEVSPSRPPPVSPVFTKELPKEIRVSEGDTITLDAEITESIPGLTFIWSVNGHDIDPSRTSEYVVWDSGNYFALTIAAATKHHLGNYELRLAGEPSRESVSTTCRVRGKSDFGDFAYDTPKRTAKIDLSCGPTSTSSTLDGIAPMFTKKLADLDCSTGEVMELTCRVVGDPIPHFFWRHNGEIVESDDHCRIRSYENTSTLKILSVESRDRGTYICSAINELGKSQTTAKVSVDGLTEPFEETEIEVNRIRPLRRGLPRLAPDGLMLESATPSELTICWSPISDETSDTSYTVEMSKDNGYFWIPVLSGLQTTRATLSNAVASPLLPIQLRVHAENALGTGPPSRPVLKIPPRASVPNMNAVKPAVSFADLGSVIITWPEPSGGESPGISYIVEVQEGPRSSWKQVATGLKDRSYIHHLKPGVSTRVCIRAYNEFGMSEPSATAIVNLPVEHLIPDLGVDPPWVSVIRPDVKYSDRGVSPGLMLHWKEAYLPEYCDECVHGLQPVYTLEWRKGRNEPWRVFDDSIVDTSYKLPGFIMRAVQEASNTNLQTPEVRVSCRNMYGSTLPTKSLRLTNFGLPKQSDGEIEKQAHPSGTVFSLPIITLPGGEEKRPLWLTSTDIDNGLSLRWEDAFPYGDSSPHGKYRIECSVLSHRNGLESESWWKPVGPPSQPILGDSYCLDLPPHSSAEQHIRLLALVTSASGPAWLDGYRQMRLPSRRQLLPEPVKSLRARVLHPKDKGGSCSVKLDWNPSGQTEGERILEEHLEAGVLIPPQEISYRVEVEENHGLWYEIGTVTGSLKPSFEHKTPISGAALSYRITPINRFGEGPTTETSVLHIPKSLSKLQGCVEDLKVLIVAPRSVFLRWRLGDEAIDVLESMSHSVASSSPTSTLGMGDSGYEENSGLRGAVRYCVERRQSLWYDWQPVATTESFQDELTGKVTLRDCPEEVYNNEYRVIAFLNNQPCAPSKPVVINVKTGDLTPDLSYQKVIVDVSTVDEYRISYPEERLEGFFGSHVLASTLPQSLEEGLSFDVEVLRENSKEWEKIATGLPSPTFAWSEVNPLLQYSFRIVGRNQFGVGKPSLATHVKAQVVIPDLSFVLPCVMEPKGILRGREPPELHWYIPRAYNLTWTLTPFTYEVQKRRVGAGIDSEEWEVFKEGLKQPRCSLEGLDPTQEYALRVVAVTKFGRGAPSLPSRKMRLKSGHSTQSRSSYDTLTSSSDLKRPKFENPLTEVVFVPIGGNLNLQCTLVSFNLNYPAKFVWSINGQTIPDLPKHEQFPSGYFQHVTGGGKSAQLRFFDCDDSDYGVYTCEASNEFGSDIKEFQVFKADAPVITQVPLPIITLSVHDTLLLPCCVDALPPAKITWTRDSKRLTSSHRTRICGEDTATQTDWSTTSRVKKVSELTVDASLRVERCVFQDAGLYTMIAENLAGRAQTSCIVRIEDTLAPRTITPRWSDIEKHYFVLHQVATGSFNRIHLLTSKKTNQEYVAKIYSLTEPIPRVLGAREFECLNRLHHRNIVEMLDAVVSDGHLFLITERLTGNHLLEEIVLGHTWTEAAAAMLIKELLEAVAYVHDEGIVHLDIQPDNIIFPCGTSSRNAGLEGLLQALSSLSVDTTGAGGRSDIGVVSYFIKLIGFSMAQPFHQGKTLETTSIMVPFTWCPDFAAPELLRIVETPSSSDDDAVVFIGPAADVWSVGIIAFLLLFGKHPLANVTMGTFEVKDVASIEDRLAEMTIAPIDEFEKDVSVEAIDFLRHLLATDSNDRPTAKECLQHPWLSEGTRSVRNLENNLSTLKQYQKIYQGRFLFNSQIREGTFMRFAECACREATLIRRSGTPAQPSESSITTEREYSIDRNLTNRIATLTVPPEERVGSTGSGTSSLRSSMLHLDIEEYQGNQSPLESPSPRLDLWRGGDSPSPNLPSSDDSSEPVKRLCDNIARERDERILPVEPYLCEGPLKTAPKLAPVFSNPLQDSHIDPKTNSVFFSCQLANPPRLPNPELLYQRSDIRKDLDALGLESFAFGVKGAGSGVGGNSVGGVAAAWYLSGCLLSEAPGVSLGAGSDGWLWLRLEDAERGMAGKVVECVVRSRNGKAKTRARILLPDPPSPPGRPGFLQASASEVIVGWTSGNDDSCEDLVYRVDVKHPVSPQAMAVDSPWKTVGYTVDRRFLITDLATNQPYRVRVCARNAVGWSPYSIASSEFRLLAAPSGKVQVTDEERQWMLRWRQASHPFGLSDHPEAMSMTAESNPISPKKEVLKRPPPSGIVKEMIQTGGLFPHLEAVKMLCQTEGFISRGAFGPNTQILLLLRCHPNLVERGDLPYQRQDKQSLRLPAYLIARITRLNETISSQALETQARQQALLLALLRTTAATPASGGLEGSPIFTQQFGIRSPCLLPQGLCLGWLANDSGKPTAGLTVSPWIPGGALLDVLLARGEYTEFSVARWVYQLLCALRWLHTAFHGRVHGRVEFDTIESARRTSALPDIVLTAVEPMEPWERRSDCFTAPELDEGGKCTVLSDLWSVGSFAYFLLLAENLSTSYTNRQTSRTPTPTGWGALDIEKSTRWWSRKTSVVTLPGGYHHLDRPLINLRATKQLSKWGRRFVYNTLQLEPMSRGSLEFWLENEWFSLRPEVVKQLTMNTIPSKYLRFLRPPENLYGVVPLLPDDPDPLSTV